MSRSTVEFINGSAKRSTQKLSVAQAENQTTGWTATAITATQSGSTQATPYNGLASAPNTPWGHATNLALTAATGFVQLASASITGLTTLGADVLRLGVFVHRPSSNPCDTFSLVIRDTVALLTHSVTFAWNATRQTWMPSSSALGGAALTVESWPDGWYRISMAYQVGWIGATDTSATSSAYALRLQLSGSAGQSLDVWGVHLSTLTYAAPVSDATATTTFAMMYPSIPDYLDGLGIGSQRLVAGPYGRPLLTTPTRELNATGQFQTSIQSGGTADGGLILQGRLSDNAPWVTIVTRVEGDMTNGTKLDSVTLYPLMRLCITELAADNNTTIGAWLTE